MLQNSSSVEWRRIHLTGSVESGNRVQKYSNYVWTLCGRKLDLMLIQDSTVKIMSCSEGLSGDLLMPRTAKISHPKQELSIPV